MDLKKLFKRKRKRRKSGSIAIPFMVTFLISLVGIGGFTVYMLDYVRNNTLDTGEYDTPTAEAFVPDSDDNMTMLLIIDPRTAATEPYNFIVFRFLPKDEKVYIMPIPENTLSNVSNQRDTLSSFYLNAGVVTAEQAVENALGFKIDRYLHCNAASFEKITELFGNVNFLVPQEFESSIGRGEYLFSGKDISDIMFFSYYPGGEKERIIKAGTILTGLFNQSSKAKVSENFEDKYVNLKEDVDTDIDSTYFYGQVIAVKYLLEHASSPAEFVNPDGTYAMESQFIFNPDFLTKLKDKFKLNE
ncbi:MAG: LCP family protein [Oscillospiraceae bacterium]|jgi:anionic cell wall polymer biosynthesis LytR-Cps2A-Psr (LCP) family protein|nr:LCP family protein [Oscillospiraceae bacterium]